MSTNYYWNKDNFEGLRKIAELADERGEPDLAEYCRLRDAGLRKPAFAALDQFIERARTLDTDAARCLVDWLLTVKTDHPGVHHFLSDPLWKRLVEPTLRAWVASSKDAVPRRWLGIYSNDNSLLLEAVALDPEDQLARGSLVSSCLRYVDFATHHLSEGLFIGSEEEARLALRDAGEHLLKMSPSPAKNGLTDWHQELSRVLADWATFRESGSGTFPEWCEANQKAHSWTRVVYYDR